MLESRVVWTVTIGTADAPDIGMTTSFNRHAIVSNNTFVFSDDFDGAGDGAVEVVAPAGFRDGDGPEAYVAFCGVAAEFEDEGEVSAEVGEVMAEAVEVGWVFVGTVCRAVIALGEGGQE